MKIRSLHTKPGTMLHFLISIAFVNALVVSSSPLCNKTSPSDVLHTIERRDTNDHLNENEDSNTQSDFYENEDDAIKANPETERFDPIISTELDVDNILNPYLERSDHNQIELPSISEDEYSRSGKVNDKNAEFNVVALLKDLYDCIELHRLKAASLCNNKENSNGGSENLNGDQKLSEKELDIKIEAKCQKINDIIRSSIEEIKSNYVNNSKISVVRSGVVHKTEHNYNLINVVDVANAPELNQENIMESTPSAIDSLIETTGNYEIVDHDIETEYSTTETTTTLDNLINSDTTLEDSFTASPLDLEFRNGESEGEPDNTIIAVTDNNYVSTDGNNPTLLENTTPLDELSTKIYLNNMYGINDRHAFNNEAVNSGDFGDSSITIHTINNVDEPTRSILYNESTVPVVKIVTREFSNGTVISVINGTETLKNNDFPSEANYSYSSEGVKNGDVKTNVPNILSGFPFGNYESSPNENLLDAQNPYMKNLIGHLYLIHGTQKIPVRFIQDSYGKLDVGIDILSLCVETMKDTASLLKAICNCVNVDLQK